jgi:hypothetical protein
MGPARDDSVLALPVTEGYFRDLVP